MAGLKYHHLNCGSFCPLTIPILNPKPLEASCHCVLVETSAGLVLIDSGYSRMDIKNPTERLGISSALLGIKMDVKQTAYEQVRTLGFAPEDVRHIVLTHLDPDHVGGVLDFPWAQVHVFEEEFHVVRQMSQKSKKFRNRFLPQNWSAETKWNFYPRRGEKWFGFDGVRDLSGLPPEILLVPLPGHSPGHCAVAMKKEQGWLVHAGDAYFQRVEITKNWLDLPASMQIYQTLLASNNRDRMENQRRLRAVLETHPEIEIFCSHDKSETHKYIPDLR